MAKLIKVILIDPITRTISEKEIKPDYREVVKLIGGQCTNIEGTIDPAFNRSESLYCNGEGWLQTPRGAFMLRASRQTIADPAVLLNCTNAGNWTSAKSTIEEVKNAILWR